MFFVAHEGKCFLFRKRKWACRAKANAFYFLKKLFWRGGISCGKVAIIFTVIFCLRGVVMKKFCISLCLILIIVMSAVIFQNSAERTEYLRIHIRANSNGYDDQSIKYLVKDLVVEYLTPIVKSASSFNDAIRLVESEKEVVNRLIDSFLAKNGFNYKSDISIKEEEFPTRVYDDLTLEAGVYEAVIINLGSGEGDNWWCVVYPPLCFCEDEVKYRSVIADFFKWLNQGG